MKMGICGTGVISIAFATLMAGNGVEVVVVGRSDKSLQACKQAVSDRFDMLMEAGKATEQNKIAALNKVHLTQDYGHLAGTEFVLEAVWENVPLKQALYEKIEAVVDDSTIIASATSALLPDILCEKMRNKSRFVVAHPIQPADLLPVIELVLNAETSPEAKTKAKALLENQMKRQVVLMEKAAPGFIFNRFQHLLFREALHMVKTGIATPEDIDKVIRFALSARYGSVGLMEYFDDVGFPLHNAVAPTIYPDLCSELTMSTLVADGIASGKTGISAGEGMYNWHEKDEADYRRRKVAPFLERFDWDLPTE